MFDGSASASEKAAISWKKKIQADCADSTGNSITQHSSIVATPLGTLAVPLIGYEYVKSLNKDELVTITFKHTCTYKLKIVEIDNAVVSEPSWLTVDKEAEKITVQASMLNKDFPSDNISDRPTVSKVY